MDRMMFEMLGRLPEPVAELLVLIALAGKLAVAGVGVWLALGVWRLGTIWAKTFKGRQSGS